MVLSITFVKILPLGFQTVRHIHFATMHSTIALGMIPLQLLMVANGGLRAKQHTPRCANLPEMRRKDILKLRQHTFSRRWTHQKMLHQLVPGVSVTL